MMWMMKVVLLMHKVWGHSGITHIRELVWHTKLLVVVAMWASVMLLRWMTMVMHWVHWMHSWLGVPMHRHALHHTRIHHWIIRGSKSITILFLNKHTPIYSELDSFTNTRLFIRV